MRSPDFKAFEQYLDTDLSKQTVTRIPSSSPINAGFKDYVIINTGTFNNSDLSISPGQRSQLKQQANEAVQQQLDSLLLFSDRPGPYTPKQELRNNIGKLVNDHEALSDTGGGVGSANAGIAIFNTNIIGINTLISNALSDSQTGELLGTPIAITPTMQKQFGEYLQHHEMAHTMLGLNEAGADFMAAALMMKEGRDADHMLSVVADARNVAGIRFPDHNKYGIECSEAIEYARAMDPDELERMDIKDLYQIAKRFDDQTVFNNLNITKEADDKVRGAIIGSFLPGIYRSQAIEIPSLSGVFTKMADTIENRTIEPAELKDKLDKIKFRDGSPEDKLADSLQASMDRLNPTGPWPAPKAPIF